MRISMAEEVLDSEISILLNIMFHVQLGRFQLELIYGLPFIFPRRPI